MENNILMEILKDRIDEKVNAAIQQVTVTCLRNIMKSFGVTKERAMDALNIPQSQRSTYTRLVENGTM